MLEELSADPIGVGPLGRVAVIRSRWSLGRTSPVPGSVRAAVTAPNQGVPAAAASPRGLALRDMPFTQGFAALSPSLERHVGYA